MSQHDMNIANQGFPAFRADLNSALGALASTSAGATEPSTTFAQQLWYDSTANLLKMRNTDNDAWITLAYFDQTNDEWEIRSAVIQAVDSAGVVIKTDDGTTRIEVQDDGDVSIDSGTLFVDAANNRVGVGTTSPSRTLDIGGTATAYMAFTPSAENQFLIGSDGNGFVVYDDTNNAYRMVVSESGDLKFNSGYGSVATAYGCRARLQFSGLGTVSITGSGNVSSISDLGVGRYGVNFTNSMPDITYSAVSTNNTREGGAYEPATTSVKVYVGEIATDASFINLVIHR